MNLNGNQEANIEQFLEVLRKFYISFKGNQVYYQESLLSDIVLPKNFILDVVNKVKDFYLSNRNRIENIDKVSIKINVYQKEISLEFTIIKKSDKYYFILLNDNYLRYEFFRTNILNTLSHELKTPLTIIKGYIQYMIKSLPTFEKDNLKNLFNLLSTMLNETYRLEEIISELIEVSKFYSNSVIIKRDIFSVLKLMQMIKNKFEPKIKSKGFNFEIEIENGDFDIIADFEKIKYIISELIENSMKYGKNKILVRCYEDLNNYYFEVIDNGIGMSKEVIDNVFNLFMRTENELNRKVYGLGVGLFLVKKIVDAHNGKIEIKSKVNKGTSIKILLPKHFSKSESLFSGS